jgi:hypothetical protein
MKQNSNATSQTRRKRQKERACQVFVMNDEPAKRNLDEHQKVNHFSESKNSQLLQAAIAKLVAGLALDDRIINPKQTFKKMSPRQTAMTSYYNGHNVNLRGSNSFSLTSDFLHKLGACAGPFQVRFACQVHGWRSSVRRQTTRYSSLDKHSLRYAATRSSQLRRYYADQ